MLENIRNAPDFALISQDKKSVYLVEVKYRNGFTREHILEIARDLCARGWNPSYLFVATREHFYFSPCNSIIKSGGEMEALKDSWVSREVAEAYLNLLREFIR